MEPFRQGRGGRFYHAALSYAQSLWLEGKPAQALLQLNKAFSADLAGHEPVLGEWRPPYEAKAWIIRESRQGERFLGNPVRHYQHLASRMNAVNPVPRRWRAWACFHMAERILGPEYERDFRQIEQENLRIPEIDEIAAGLEENGWPGERGVWARALPIAG
jgi:hypothetical protein